MKVIKKIQRFASVHRNIIFIVSLIILIAALHYSTPIHLHHLHELYRIFFYLPIILAAFQFRLAGGLLAALSVIIIYFPHVVFQWGGDFWFNFSRFLEMVMYLVIGSVTGILAQRQRREQEKYEQVARELAQSYEKLKHQAEQISEIEEQLRSSERMAVVGELAASLAHEVRNPLGSIWGVVEILKDEFACEPKAEEFIGILVKEVKRLNDVVENYLNLSRSPRIELHTCDLEAVVESVFELVKLKARKQQIKLKKKFPTPPLQIKANTIQMRQILINLVLNSMAAIGQQGEIKITGQPKTDSGAESPEKSVHLSISDTGKGMQSDELKKIFKPFYTTKESGTGLGLSIVKRIADQNKWKIEVNSTPGAGTTVTLIF